MEQAIRRRTMQVTVVCLVAAGVLLALGVARATASLVLAAALLAIAGGLYLTRPSPSIGFVAGIDVDGVLSTLWVAPALAALPILLELGATPAELQALGGLVGLAGMANYFLRPLYLLVYAVGTKLVALAGGPTRP